jgi:uncharacterized protein YaeQ
MALKSTIHKIDLTITDMDRNYFESHALTVARHPSESDDRMMIRILAFAANANEDLSFGAGVSTDDQPDIWEKSPSGEIMHWIDLGCPDPRRVRKACGRARLVTLYCYGGNKATMWWEQNKQTLSRSRNLRVLEIGFDDAIALGKLAERALGLQCTIEDGEIWLIKGEETLNVVPRVLLDPSA